MRIKILRFIKDKETKRMVRFAEQPLPGAEAVIPYLYVSKAFAGPALRVLVKIEIGDAQPS